MKIGTLAIIGFVAGSAGGVFLESRKPPPPMPAADSLALNGDSLAGDSIAVADSGLVAGEDSLQIDAVVDTLTDSTAVDSTVADTTHIAAQVDTVTVMVPMEAPAEPEEPTGPSVEEITSAHQSVARILGQMKPAEAAGVISGMTDEEAEAVIRNLGTRKAALLLASLPDERAARLARRLMVPRGDGS